MQDNLAMIMQFVQNEALQHKLFIRNELWTVREFVQDQVQDEASEQKAIHSRQTSNAQGICPRRKHLSTKPFVQDNFPIIMQFVQDEALQHKLSIQDELRALKEFVQDESIWARSHSCWTIS